MNIHRAIPADAVALSILINSAFRAESPFIKGDRTNRQQLLDKMRTGTFYGTKNSQGNFLGCVYLETANAANPDIIARGEGAGYIGMLAIEPAHQGQGLGKLLMTFAEDELRRRGCARVQLRVVHRRTELLEFYVRLGYEETGQSPYPVPEKTLVPLHFIHMEKQLL